jgi:glutamyl-tRNA reductase
MPRLLMLGISHHAAPVEVRERVAIDEATWRLHAPPQPATVLLSTCNRLEVYAWVEGRSATPRRSLVRALARATGVRIVELEPYLTCRVGRDALLHLVRVTSGLDSLLVGEEQIIGQVRNALRAAENANRLPASLRGAFQRAIESARRIRGATRLGQAPSIAAAGISVARRTITGDVNGKLAAVLGAGVMARAAAEALLAAGARVRVLNRTPAHAERLMANMRGTIDVESLDTLPQALADAVLVVGATAARSSVVTVADVRSALERRGTPLVLLDIAMPRDIDPDVRELPDVKLIDLDDLERLCPVDTPTRRAEQNRAEDLAVEEAERLEDWLRSRAISPAIAELRTYAESIRTGELRRSATRLRDLTPEQIAAVDALTSGIVKKLMHGPTVALREAGLGRSRAHILRVVRPRTSRVSSTSPRT